MTVLFGNAQTAVRALKMEAYARHEAKTQRKYHLRAGDMYLHQSGLHLQNTDAYAWKGTMDQARAMRRDYPAAAGCRTREAVTIPNIVFNVEEA